MTNLRMIALFREIAKILACIAACLGWLFVLLFPLFLIFTSIFEYLNVNSYLNSLFKLDFGAIGELTSAVSNLVQTKLNFLIGVLILPLFILITSFAVYAIFPKKFWKKRISLTESTFLFPIVTTAVCVVCALVTTIVSLPQIETYIPVDFREGISLTIKQFSLPIQIFYYIPYILLIAASVLIFLSNPVQGAKLDQAMAEYVLKMDTKGSKKGSKSAAVNVAATTTAAPTPVVAAPQKFAAPAAVVVKQVDEPDVVIDMIETPKTKTVTTKTTIVKKSPIVVKAAPKKPIVVKKAA